MKNNHINWDKVTDNQRVINLIKKIEKLENEIRDIDPKALIKYNLELIKHKDMQ